MCGIGGDPTPAPIAPITMRTVAMVAGISGAFWYCVTVTLDDMTRADCNAGHVRAAMRPKPPSLAEQALDVLNLMLMFLPPGDQREQGETIRRALERLQELEKGNE